MNKFNITYTDLSGKRTTKIILTDWYRLSSDIEKSNIPVENVIKAINLETEFLYQKDFLREL
jgi:hypothetical protein